MILNKESALWVFGDLPGRTDLIESWFQYRKDEIAAATLSCKIKVYMGAGDDLMPKDIADSVQDTYSQMHFNFSLAKKAFYELSPEWVKAYAAAGVQMPSSLLPSIQGQLRSMLEELNELRKLKDVAASVLT